MERLFTDANYRETTHRLGCFHPPAIVYRILVIYCLLNAAVGCRLLRQRDVESDRLAACRKLSQQGVAAIEAERWGEAEALMSKALQTCPDDTEAKRHYAEALWRQGKRSEAIAQLKDVVERSGTDANVRVRLGEMLLREGQLIAALEQAEAALDLAPGAAGTWKLHARVLQKKGRLQSALADYQRALAYCPEDREILLETAEIYRQLGRPHEALATLNSLIDTYPLGEEPPEVVRLQGMALAAQGRQAAATIQR